MYNKYFTMKRSELKEAIKAEITSVLSEGTGIFGTSIRDLDQYNPEDFEEAKFIKFKGDSDDNKMEVEAEREMNTPDGELKVYTVKTDDGVQSYTADQVELVEVYQTNSKMSQIVSLFQDMMDDEYDGQDYRKVLNMVLKAIDDDYKAAEREGEKFSRIREEDEMSDDEMDKKASRGAKKEPIGKEAERLAQVQKFMRQMQDKGIVGKDKKILDTPKYKEEFAKFKADLKK